jgi:hypothetical protein
MPNFIPGNRSGFQLDPLIDTEEEVLAIRSSALKAMREGRQILEWSGNGTEVKKEFIAPISEILAETRRCLKLINPEVYGHVVRQSNMLRVA